MNESDLDYTSPSTFSFKRRVILNVAPFVAGCYVRAVGLTKRRVCLDDQPYASRRAAGQPVLIAALHEGLILTAYWHRGSQGHTLTSHSFDGELAARFAQRMGMRALRGSSSTGGYKALKELGKAVRQRELVGFTVDGPKGPRRQVKPGVAILSAQTRIPVMPFAIVATSVWRLKSWDRMMVPKPFGVIMASYGEAIEPPARMSSESIDAMRLEIEAKLNALQTSLEEKCGVDPLFVPAPREEGE